MLKDGDKYFEYTKPLYIDTPTSSILSARTHGACGDGLTDDTEALNALFAKASEKFDEGFIAFIDAGYYKVTDTIYIPPNIRIVGEALSSVIMGAGEKFQDMENPHPVVQVAKPGETGVIEWSDTIISTQGATAGAIVLQYNLASPADNPAGMWDVHVRVGGFAGSQLQLADCEKKPELINDINPKCIAAHTGVHMTKSAAGLYTEGNWIWTAE